MTEIDIAKEKCKGCELCISACNKHVIEMSKDLNESGYFYAHVTDPEKCVACRLCAVICPEVGIEIEKKDGKA